MSKASRRTTHPPLPPKRWVNEHALCAVALTDYHTDGEYSDAINATAMAVLGWEQELHDLVERNISPAVARAISRAYAAVERWLAWLKQQEHLFKTSSR